MVATASTQRFFRKADDEDNEWHAYRDDTNVALCGKVQMTYNVDQIADAVPASGKLHKGCEKALAGEAKAEAKAEADAAKEV